MTRIAKLLLLSVVLALAISPPTFAQTSTTRTYLSSALASSNSQNTVCVGSVTGITASGSQGQTFIFMGLEEMQVRTVNTSSNCMTVTRAVKGYAAAHPANEVVWYGGGATFDPNSGNIGGGAANPTVGGSQIPAVFVGVDPTGTCTRANNVYLPVINPNTGNIWDCILSTTSTTSEWVGTNLNQLDRADPYKKLAASATTYTVLPSDRIIGYNTTSNGTMTVPAFTGFVGKRYTFQIELTGAQSLTIATSSGQTINGASSITIGGTNTFQGVSIYSDGTNWFAPRAAQ